MGYDQQKLRERVKAFADETIAPLAASLDQAGGFPAGLWQKLGDAGLLGMTVATDLGGQELGFLAHVIAMEEISRASASVGLSYAAHSNLCAHNLYRHGKPAQRRRYLPGLCSGKRVGALAMSEAGAGSDIIGSMDCHAERQGDDWIANGSKKWITNVPGADVLIVYMRTSAPGAAPALTAFVIEDGLPGFSQSGPMDKLGMRGSHTGELSFENCRIPEEQVLGRPHQGVAVLMSGLDSERLLLSAGPIGIMQAALDIALPYCHARSQFQRPIGTFELIQSKLADHYTRLQAARSWTYRVARQFDHGQASSRDAASCYLLAAENAVKVTLETIQILAGTGYLADAPAGRLLRDAKLYDIGGGTNEIRRLIIGRELFNHGQ